MKRATLLIATGLALCRVPAAWAVGVQSTSDIQFWIGTGTAESVLLIDWQDGKNLPGQGLGQALAWGYRWDPATPKTGLDMIQAVAAADPRLTLYLDQRSLGLIVFGLYYDLDGDGGTFAFDPDTESGGASDADDHFREGWRFEGFWGYRTGAANGPTRPAWVQAGSGAGTRALANGSWDAWVFSSDLQTFSIPQPSEAAAAAIPEPGSALLAGIGALMLWRRR